MVSRNKTIKPLTKKQKIDRLISGAILAFQLITSCILVGLILNLNMLTMKYTIPIVIVVVLFFALVLASQLIKKRNSKRKLFGRIISLVLSCLMIFASTYVLRTSHAINAISGADYQTQSVLVYVKADSEANAIQDVQDGTFAINKISDRDNTDYAVQQINEATSTTIATREYDSYQDMYDALLDGEVDAMIMNEAYEAITEQYDEEFDHMVKVIYSIERQQDVETTPVSDEMDVTKDTFTLYITGIDTYGPVSTVSRSDVNMLVTVNPQTHQILLTNIPRDYYVTLHSYGQLDKLTHAGIYGVNESMSTLEDLIGIDIDYYARVNFSSVETIVDALGGITVNSEYAFSAGGYSFSAGSNTLNGKEALAFSRERYSFSAGDRQRGKNQQAVITGIINKMISPSIITNYTNILSAVSDSFQTSLSTSEIQSLVRMQLNDMSSWDIQTYSLDGSGASRSTYSYGSTPLYVMIPDQSTVTQAKTYIDAMESGQRITVTE